MKENIKKIIILDFEVGEVHVFDFDENIFKGDDLQYYLDIINEKFNLHLNENNCQWMIVDNLTLRVY